MSISLMLAPCTSMSTIMHCRLASPCSRTTTSLTAPPLRTSSASPAFLPEPDSRLYCPAVYRSACTFGSHLASLRASASLLSSQLVSHSPSMSTPLINLRRYFRLISAHARPPALWNRTTTSPRHRVRVSDVDVYFSGGATGSTFRAFLSPVCSTGRLSPYTNPSSAGSFCTNFILHVPHMYALLLPPPPCTGTVLHEWWLKVHPTLCMTSFIRTVGLCFPAPCGPGPGWGSIPSS